MCQKTTPHHFHALHYTAFYYSAPVLVLSHNYSASWRQHEKTKNFRSGEVVVAVVVIVVVVVALVVAEVVEVVVVVVAVVVTVVVVIAQ